MSNKILPILALFLLILAVPAFATTVVEFHGLNQNSESTESDGNFNGMIIAFNGTKYPASLYNVTLVSVNISLPSTSFPGDIRLWDNTTSQFVVNATITPNGVVNFSYLVNTTHVYFVLGGNATGGSFNYKSDSFPPGTFPIMGDALQFKHGVACQSVTQCSAATALELDNAYQLGNLTLEIVSLAAGGNTPPVMISNAASISANNLTIIISANATDANNATLRYNTTINRSGVIEQLNFSAFVPANLTVQYLNYTVSQAGNYSVCARANDGVNNSANTICTSFAEITFPSGTAAPVLQSASLTVAADNFSISLFANATDNDTATVAYNYTVFLNGAVFASAITGTFAQGVTANIATLSITQTGNYSANVSVVGAGAVITTNTVEATVSDQQGQEDSQALNFVIMLLPLLIIIVLALVALRKYEMPEYVKNIILITIAIILTAIIIRLLILLI